MIVDELGTDEILASAFKSKERCRALCLVFCRASFARVLARSLARIRFSLKLVALHTVLGGNWVLAQWFRLMGCEKQSNFFVVWFFFPRNEMRQKVEEGEEGRT
jgi:hypothetical protein